VIRKASYAPIIQTVSSEGPTSATLRPAIDTWVDVRNNAGAPLKDAQIVNISIRTPENRQAYIWRGMEHLLGYEFTPSNAAGRLNLPSLPEGALIDIRIDHPRWAQSKLSNVRVAQGRLCDVALPSGVMTTFQFIADLRTPMRLDGLTCEILLLSQSSSAAAAATLNRVPMKITGDRIVFCAHPATYTLSRLKATGVAITPVFNRLIIPPEAEKKVRFLVRKTVNVSGRVMRRDGMPHKGVSVFSQIENLSPDGLLPGTEKWTYCAETETDAAGKYTIALAPGRGRVNVAAEGFVTDRDYTELDIRVEGAHELPDFVTERLEPVRGQVIDEDGRSVPGAIVRMRCGPLLGMQPSVSDAQGKFEITLPRIPLDHDTQQRHYELNLAAFVADQPLKGVTRINLRDTDSLQNVRIVLRPESSPDTLLTMEDSRRSLARKQNSLAKKTDQHPTGDRGRPAPELDGAAWFNTDARSLKDFHGRYVLLDFWFTDCGPCHGDFPSVNLVHDRFEKHGVTVIGVHDNSSTPEAVREHCRQQGLTFPIVVDHPDERILNAYRELGVHGFPCYLLIGPDGNILENDRVTDGPFLRLFKIELLRKYVLDRKK